MSDTLFDEFAPTSHVGTAGPDEATGTPAIPGLWDEPVRYGPPVRTYPPPECAQCAQCEHLKVWHHRGGPSDRHCEKCPCARWEAKS